MNDNHSHFRTSDTALAAFLQSEGYTLLEIDYSDEKRAELVFALNSPNEQVEIEDKRREYYGLRAIGNVAQFHENYRKLARMIRFKLPV